MVDMERLKEKVCASGMTMVSIAKHSGISRETLYNRFKGTGEFTASEITALTKSLHLSREERDEIFFATKCELNSRT